ncbi:MAG: hypothetical protein IPJ77_15645 [Planctomycetes bacterium]|nr:hypothetical protein [Planctomycetota bacterium]
MSVTESTQNPITQLLDARAADPRVLGHAERRIFVRYDAWTFPVLRKALDDPKTKAALSPAAQRLFLERMPECPFAPGLFALVADVLGRGVLDRVERYCDAGELPAVPELLEHEEELLRAEHLDLDRAIVRMAEYQERIFDAAYPPDGDRPSLGLELAFANFASGALGFLPPPPAPLKRPTERSIEDALNCEPDGWLFHAFAEFAWNAARVRTGRSAYWLALAQQWAALQEVWAWTYGPAIGARSRADYGRWRRRAGEPIPLAEIQALTEVYRQAYPTREALAQRLAWNALRAFKDRR